VRALCISIHDVAPRTLPACQRIAELVKQVDRSLALTLLVVPYYHGHDEMPAEYQQWVSERIAEGDEVALHGLTHRDESRAPRRLLERVRRQIYTAGEGEFSNLGRAEAAQRIERGRRWFADRGWPVSGFVAPAWLVSPGTWEVLRKSDFVYTTTLTRFHVLPNKLSMRAPSVVYSTRSRWRRWASRGWNDALVQCTRGMPLVRVGFHPGDADHPEVLEQALELVRRLAHEREAITKSAFARRVG
jgi:predicted deacetylase